jgi:hypothetical protein
MFEQAHILHPLLRSLTNSRPLIEDSIFSGHETGCRVAYYIDFLSNFLD